jgi:threonyl-tRNA synthetase
VRAEVDMRSEKLGYKIREAQIQKVPYMLVIGKKEEDSRSVAVRTRGGEQTYGVKVEEFVSQLREKVSSFQ